MMSLTMMGLTPGNLVRVILHCIFSIPLVVLVDWGLAFLYQHESSPNVMFLSLSCSCQQESSPTVVNSSRCFGAQIPDFLSKFQNQFYSYSHGLTLRHSFLPLWLHQKYDPALSNRIHLLDFKSCSKSTKDTAFIQCVDGRDPQIHEL